MRLVGSAILVVLASNLGGCHVTERAQQCRLLADLVEQSRPELEKSGVPENPTPKQLRKRAHLYGQLGTGLEGIKLDDREVSEQRDKVSIQLQILERQLNQAAVAVEEYARVAKEEAEELDETKRAKKAEQAQKKEPSEKDEEPPHRVVSGLIRKQAEKPPARTRALAKVRDYGRARSAAQGAGRGLSSSLDRLQKACH